jgi:hypothetical protein
MFSVRYELHFYVQYLFFQSPEYYMTIQPYFSFNFLTKYHKGNWKAMTRKDALLRKPGNDFSVTAPFTAMK